ncbi:MAG: tetratricopeptide repeat protein [Streptomycetaceae bacterium]|nr:tetratricopeptide repeat protein [Streptomycetaceae bacterium]
MNQSNTLYGLAGRALTTGQFAEAADLYEQAVAGFEAEHGPDSDATLQALLEWGLALYNLQRYDEAEIHQRRALQARVRSIGADHGDTLNTRVRLAESIGAQGRWQEAEALARETVELGEARGWPLHESVISGRLAVAWIRRRQERWEEATELARTVVDQFHTVRDDDHPFAVAARHLLVECLLHTGDLAGAEKQAAHVRQIRTTKLGPDHPYTIIISCDLARVLTTAGRPAEARALAAQVLPTAMRVLGDDNAHTRRLRELAAA